MKRLLIFTICIALVLTLMLTLGSCTVINDIKVRVEGIIADIKGDTDDTDGGNTEGEDEENKGDNEDNTDDGEDNTGDGDDNTDDGNGDGGNDGGNDGEDDGEDDGDEPVKVTHTVTFGGAGADSTVVLDEGGKLTAPEAPTKAGYNFGGWYNGDKLWDFDLDTVTADVRLEARWLIITYSVTYELMGGLNSDENPISFDVEDGNILLGAPSRAGYIFSGWYKDDKYTEKIELIETDSLADLTLYARWELDTYEIKYELDGGVNSESNPTTYDAESGKIILGAPEREGYVFLGWFADPGFVSAITEIDVSAFVDITVYAKWKSFDEFFEYVVNDDGSGVTITGFTGDAKVLKIPAKLAGLDVVKIGDEAFKGSTGIEELVIPDSVITIGVSAFEGCSGLRELTLGSGVLTIGDKAFYLCIEIIVIVIPDNVKTVGASAFEGCSGATSITVGNGVTSIGDSAFSGCSSAEKLTIGESVTTVGNKAFYECIKIVVIVIPDSVTSLGDYVFYGCSGATSITVGNGVSSIGTSAFEGCLGATDLVIGSSVKTIGERAFYYCIKIIIIIIPDSVTSIGNSAFEGCSSAESIKIGEGTTVIGTSAFSNCSSAQSVTIGSNVQTIGERAFYFCVKIVIIVIPDSVTSLGDSAFEGCSGATSIKIGNGVTSIGALAFSGCSSAQSVTIGSKVQTIGERAFYYCVKVIVIIIPDSVRSIGASAFEGCFGATSITVGNGVTFIGDSAFSGCSSAEKVTLGSNVQTLGNNVFYLCIKIIIIVIPGSVTSVGENVFGGCTNTTVCTGWEQKPSGWTETWVSSDPTSAPKVQISGQWEIVYDIEIIVAVFGDWYTVTEPTCTSYGLMQRDCINIPDLSQTKRLDKLEHTYVDKVCTSCGQRVTEGLIFTLSSNGKYYSVTGLGDITDTNIVIPAEHEGKPVTAISSAFNGRTDITSVYIPNSVTSIGNSAFSGCTGLTELVIPDSVTSIGSGALSGCTSLEKLTIPFTGYKENTLHAGQAVSYPFGSIFGSIDRGDGVVAVTQTYSTSHSGSSGKPTYYIPASLRSVTVSRGIIAYGAFENCSMLTEVNIGAGVSQIGQSVFSGCTGLTEMFIPKTVKSVSTAFSGCTSLEYVEFEGLTSISMSAFNNSGVKRIKIGDAAVLSGNSLGGTNTNVESVILGNYIEIPAACFSKFEALKHVEIGYGAKNIGTSAFENCKSLTSVTLPASVTKIGNYAFHGCTLLESIALPESLVTLGGYAFQGCSALKYVSISDNLAVIQTYAFTGCTALEEIKIGSGLKTVESYAFNGCTSIRKVDIRSLEAWCAINFTYSTNPLAFSAELYLNGELVEELIIPDGVTSIGPYAFYGCTSITSIKVPNSVTKIGQNAFANMPYLKSVVIGEGVTEFGVSILSGCGALESLTVPFIGESLNENGARYPLGYFFGTVSFAGADKTTQYYYKAGATASLSQSYYIPATLVSVTVTSHSLDDYAFQNCSKIKTVTLGVGVTSIGKSTFANCSSLEGSILTSLLNSVVSIGERAFQGCTTLTEVILPKTLESLGGYAFYNCTGITKITLSGSGSLVINPYTFGNCTSLTEVVIGDGVSVISENVFNSSTAIETLRVEGEIAEIGNGVFASATKLTAVYIDDVAAWCNITFANSGSNPFNRGTATLYVGGEAVETLVIPEGVTEIKDYAFFGCKGILHIVFPSTLTEIGMSAFEGCSALRELEIPESVTHIRGSAFAKCSAIESITVPGTVEEIGGLAFYYCSALKSVVVEDGVKTIGTGAFMNAMSLESITLPFIGRSKDATEASVETLLGYIFYKENTAYVSSMTSASQVYGPENTDKRTFYSIPTTLKSVTITGGNVFYGAFSGFKMITNVTLAEGVTGISDYAFHNCAALTSVSLPSTVLTIGSYAFNQCGALESVTVPEGVTEIGSHAFYQLAKLVSVKLPETVTHIGDYAFYQCSALTEINIPGSCKEIGDYAFNYCRMLEADLVLPNLETVGDYAFYYCQKITSLTGCNSLKSLGNYALSGSGIKNITIPRTIEHIGEYALPYNLNYNEYENAYYLGSESDPYVVLVEAKDASIKSCKIAEGTKWICKDAFESCANITEITVPDSVIFIGENAFYNCSKLETVKLPAGITEIRSGTFYNCSSLASISIPESVTSIGASAFGGCAALTSFHIGKNVTEIDFSAFAGCSSLENVTVDSENEYYAVIEGNICSKDGSIIYKYLEAGKAESYTIPSYIKTVGTYAFSGSKYLKYLTIPETVTAIETRAFSDCQALESVNILASTTELSEYCFSGCGKLKSFTLAENITTISFGAFERCGFTEIVIPDHVQVIQGRAFERCEYAKNITLGKSVTTLGNSVFASCYALEELRINSERITSVQTTNNDTFSYGGSKSGGFVIIVGNTVKSMPSSFFSYRSNYGRPNVTAMIFEKGSVCESIGYRFFEYSTTLTDLVIPVGMTVGNYMFSSSTSLKNVYYCGTEEEWAVASLGAGNDIIKSATRYYYSETEPTAEGNFWYYDANGRPAVWG